jgi:NADPH:quinone reductase
VLNYITAYQMMHRSVHVKAGQRVLVHGALGGVGSALLQLGKVSRLEMYGTCSAKTAQAVSDMGCVPIDYQHQNFVEEIHRLTMDGVDIVFDPIGGSHLWESRKALRLGGSVVGYGLITSIRGEDLRSTRPGRRQRFRGTSKFALYIVAGWLLPGRKRVVPYSIQTLKRLKPAWFREDLIALLDLLKEKKLKPIVAQRLSFAEARHAHEMLAGGGVIGELALVCEGYQVDPDLASTAGVLKSTEAPV